MHRGLPIALSLSLSLLVGCMVVVPTDKRTELRRKIEWGKPVVATRPVASVATHARGTGVDIQVTWKMLCDRAGRLVIEHEHSKSAELEVLSTCGHLDGESCVFSTLISLVYAPFTLAGSGLITGIMVVAAKDRVETSSQDVVAPRAACTQPGANLRLTVQAPGREPALVTTDARGRAHLDLGDAALAQQVSVGLTPDAGAREAD